MEKNEQEISFDTPNLPNHRFQQPLNSLPRKAGNALVTPLVFQVSMGGGDCILSGDLSARLPAYKKNSNI
uniref:SFRICE_002834 n=1 Tax=Spodoptera frugiperda TaxID=7108 RepID=A0A2H1VEQ9_SPOFR